MSAAPHQATCVALAGRGLLIEGAPGSGKSSLALALIDRGATLVGDDGVLLEQRAGQLWALPPPHTAGLIEVRGVGLVPMPSAPAPLALLLILDPAAPRFVEQAENAVRSGVTLPCLRLWPASPVLHLRAEQAMAMHGLQGRTPSQSRG